MVEHDLAKVGVASSNLVSRSILFFLSFLFLPLPLLAVPTIYIDKEYCVKESDVKASFFGYTHKDNTTLFTIPKERMHFSVSTQQLLSFFNDKNVTVVNRSDGIVLFKRNCDLMGKREQLEKALMEKFQELSPSISFDSKPNILTKSPLPVDFEHYLFEALSLNEAMLKKSNGSFIASFTISGKRKKITFYYQMDAKLPAFKAKRNLQSGKILQNDDFEMVLVALDTLPSKAIIGELSPNLMVKNSIQEGQIFSEYLFSTKKALMKKESIKALLTEGNLVIELHVILQEDANIGDVVKVKTEQGKVLNAKILSLKEAMILE